MPNPSFSNKQAEDNMAAHQYVQDLVVAGIGRAISLVWLMLNVSLVVP